MTPPSVTCWEGTGPSRRPGDSLSGAERLWQGRLSFRLHFPTAHCLLLGGNHTQHDWKGAGDKNKDTGSAKLGSFNPFWYDFFKRVPSAVHFSKPSRTYSNCTLASGRGRISALKGSRAESDGEETPVGTDTVVSIASGRGAEKSGISLSQSRQHILTARESQIDMTHGAYSPAKTKKATFQKWLSVTYNSPGWVCTPALSRLGNRSIPSPPTK